MNDLIHCFTFSMSDLADIQALVKDYRKLTFVSSFFPQITNTTFRVTLKAKSVYNDKIANPDCVLTFQSNSNNVYNIHYETANSVLLNVDGIQRSFDYSIRMKEASASGERRFEFVKKPSPWDMKFLESNYKFGMKNDNTSIFMLSCQIAQFIYAVLPCILSQSRVDNRIYYSFIPNWLEEGRKYIEYSQKQERKSTLLNGWDVVTLTEKQYFKVVETLGQNHIEYDTVNIPLPKFCLSIFDGKETSYYFYEKNGNSIKCGVTDTSNFVTKWFDIGLGKTDGDGLHTYMHVSDEESGLAEWLNEKADGNHEENWSWCANTFFIVNAFMLHFGDVTMEVETKQASAPSAQNTRKHKHRTNTVRLFKTYKLVKGWKSNARKKVEITCSAWGVRGHFRHYRNGKTIFIEPFVKGKERDQYKGKEYVLLPYKDA